MMPYYCSLRQMASQALDMRLAIKRTPFGTVRHLYQNVKKKWSLELDTILGLELYSGWVEAR